MPTIHNCPNLPQRRAPLQLPTLISRAALGTPFIPLRAGVGASDTPLHTLRACCPGGLLLLPLPGYPVRAAAEEQWGFTSGALHRAAQVTLPCY